jgi:chloramphenicol-sensitive protein RarD
MAALPTHHDEERAGAVYAGAAYVVWGAMPLYWRLVGHVSSFQLMAHRVVWCAVCVGIVVVAQGHLPRIVAALRQPGVLRTLALTSLFITFNWTLYIYCVESRQLLEASLGYYINPLVSFALGYAFFGERMSRVRLVAAAIAAAGVAVKMIVVGHVSWIALALALSFGLYGYFRKRVQVPALDGLMVEAGLMTPIMLGLMAWWTIQGVHIFTSSDIRTDILLIVGGPMTAIPLALFGAGVRRVRMTTLGFLQYLSPTITLVLAIFGFGEQFTTLDAVTFGCVWAALILVAVEGGAWRGPLVKVFSRTN